MLLLSKNIALVLRVYTGNSLWQKIIRKVELVRETRIGSVQGQRPVCAQGVKSHEYKYKFFTRVAREIGYLHFSAPSRGNREEGYVCMRIWRGKFLFHRERESGKNENENNTVSCEYGMLDAKRNVKG